MARALGRRAGQGIAGASVRRTPRAGTRQTYRAGGRASIRGRGEREHLRAALRLGEGEGRAGHVPGGDGAGSAQDEGSRQVWGVSVDAGHILGVTMAAVAMVPASRISMAAHQTLPWTTWLARCDASIVKSALILLVVRQGKLGVRIRVLPRQPDAKARHGLRATRLA